MARKRTGWLLWGGALTVLVGFLTLSGPANPDGRYVDSLKIAVAGDAFWKLENGEFTFVHEEITMLFGSYTNQQGAWIWLNNRGKGPPSVFQLEPRWWGLRFRDDSGVVVETWHRRLLPFPRPTWIPAGVPDF